MSSEREDVEPFLNIAEDGERTPLYRPTANAAHLRTYTAGEDGSRLADMAKEFGLQNQRRPRKQVRAKRHDKTKRLIRIMFDSTMEDARMRAVWTSHSVLEGDDVYLERQLYARMTNSHDDSDLDDLLLSMEGAGEEDDTIEEDPHAHGLGSNLTSAMLGVVKGMVGPAILYLPHGFANAGYMTAIPLMSLGTIMYLYSSSCLLEAWKLESTLNVFSRKKIILSYPELAYRAFGSTGEAMVKTGIALMQSGVCLTYLIFVPQNLSYSMKTLFGWTVAPNWWLIVMVSLQIPLSWIRDIRKLTMTNLVANMLILYGLLLCLGFSFQHMVTASSVAPPLGPLESIWERFTHLDQFKPKWFLFIGTSVLLFEGSITLLVPLQEAVHSQAERDRFPRVYQRVIGGIICFYCFFGMTCWMAFGDTVRTVFTTSLPAGYLATSVQLAYSLAVVFTFPLQNFPALEICTKFISTALQRCNGKTIAQTKTSALTQRNILSSMLVCALAVVALLTMDSLDKVVSLMGSLLGCPIAFFFPPLIHSKLAASTISPTRKLANTVVAFLGVCAMIAASVTTLIEW